MKVLGVTGGMGSGKTTVCRIFKTLGVPVFSSDEISKSILFSDEIQKEIIGLFGVRVQKNNRLDKNKLSKIIFSEAGAIKKINNFLHPKVGEAFDFWKSQQKSKLVIKEAAILFESGAYKSCDYVINVFCNEQERIRRVMLRDNRSEAEIKSILSNQLSDDERIYRSDITINNDCKKLLPQVLNLYQDLVSRF
ncbi:MAG: dephospho-CoA kinase [Flavobacteriales bacterium]|nr:dephospho-CoA kinase [Flavobacteriales bacterium]|tara:strand:+ start:1558 stop:2136 length:579 start_codon:yes stop_codon:yes gene_type:complete